MLIHSEVDCLSFQKVSCAFLSSHQSLSCLIEDCFERGIGQQSNVLMYGRIVVFPTVLRGFSSVWQVPAKAQEECLHCLSYLQDGVSLCWCSNTRANKLVAEPASGKCNEVVKLRELSIVKVKGERI